MSYFKSKHFVPLSQLERKVIFISMFLPLLFVIILGLILSGEMVFNIDLNFLGTDPRTIHGLAGIIFMPLLHENFSHWISNAIPLLVLGFCIIYFYRQIAYRIFLIVWIADGAGVWLLGRSNIHIGASGLVYGLVSFLLFSGLLRKNRNLLALAFLVVVLYGSILYGMFPFDENISWEGHLFGFLSGIGCAVFYREKGPKDDPVPEWMIHDDEETQEIISEKENQIQIQYQFKETEEQ